MGIGCVLCGKGVVKVSYLWCLTVYDVLLIYGVLLNLGL